MKEGYFVEGDTIIINRGLTELDNFVRKFLDVLKRHSDYLVVSGFVSICSGRTRGTEDVDVIVPLMEQSKFSNFFSDLENNGFWCYQGNDMQDVYAYMENLQSIRFALNDQMLPNIELIPFNLTKKAKYFEFTHPQKIKVEDFEFKVPPIEFEILYKEIVLGSKKDLEDARHLRSFFSDILDEKRFKEYEPSIRGELK